MSDLSLELVKQVVESALHRDLEAVDDLFAPDATIQNRRNVMDKNSLLELFEESRPWELTNIEYEDVLICEQEAVVFLAVEYRLTNKYIGIDPQNDSYTTLIALFLGFEDEQVTEYRGISNREDFLSALGVLTDDVTSKRLELDLVGDKIRLEYREVLARLLRHNIRNNTAVITAIAEELLADETTASLGRRLRAATDDLTSAAEKARKIDQQVLAREPSPEPIVISDIVETVVEEQKIEDETTVSITADDNHELPTDRLLLTSPLTELVENAIKHAGESPEVTVAIESTDRVGYDVAVTVTDNGPGIPKQELGPIRAEQETDLEHASGIGLWKVKWCVDRLEGDVQFETPECGGTTVRLQLPDLS